MKILILTCGTGEGHNSAGRAIQKRINELGHYCETRDIYSFAPKGVSKIVNKSYVQMTLKAPVLFTSMYRFGGWLNKNMDTTPVYAFNSLYKRNYINYINKKDFDVIVVSHIFAGEAMRCARKNGIRAKIVFISTDYTCVPMTAESRCDYYIIPSEYQREEYINKRVPEDKIYPFGIPVDEKFIAKTDKQKARQLLSLPQKKTVLVMTGSMGFGKADVLTEKLYNSFGSKINIIIMCGNNKKLYNGLNGAYISIDTVNPIGFTQQVNLYMDAADVVFSKPGGLSSTECAVKNVPLIHTPPIPGCESANAQFFSEKGMSIAVKDLDEAVVRCRELLENDELITKMEQAQSNIINKNALNDIVSFVLSLEKD